MIRKAVASSFSIVLLWKWWHFASPDVCVIIAQVEFNDLIEYVLETFMSMAFEDPMKCAQNLFGLTAKDVEAIQASEDSE